MSFQISDNIKTVLNNSNELVFVINSSGTIFFVNSLTESITDITNGHNIFDYISEKEDLFRDVNEQNSKTAIQLSLSSKLNFIDLNGNISFLSRYEGEIFFVLSLSQKIANTNADGLNRKIFESENKYQKLIEQSSDCIMLHKNGIIEYINEAGIRMLGAKNAEEIIGRTNISLIHEDDRPFVKNRITELQTIKQFTNWAEQRFVKLNGEIIIVEAAAAVVEINGEKVIQVIIKDITERKNFEKQLIHNERQLSAFIKALPDDVYVIDENGKYIDVISSVHNNTKKGKNIFDLFSNESAFSILKTIRKTIEHKKSYTLEYDIKGNYFEGRTAYLEMDEPNKRVLWISRDITSRKKAEILVKESEDAIKNFLRQSSDGIVIVDNDGKIVEWNKAQENITGFKQLEILGKYIWDVQYSLASNSENRKYTLDELKNNTLITLKNRSNTSFIQPHTTDIRTKDNQIKTIETVIFPIDTENGRKIGSIARDITSIKEAEDNLIRAKKLAEEANQAKSLFIAKISHEIRTPLNGIVGFTNLLLDNDYDKDTKEMLSLIKNSGETLSKLITDILDFSKIESGKISLQRIEFDLNSLIESSIKSFNLPATKKSLQLAFTNNNKHNNLLIGDKICLRQIIVNLLSNAIKYTDKGNIQATFDTNIIEKSNKISLTISIKDTGRGIAPEVLQNIFSDVFKIAYTDSNKGSGLGLSIVNSLVKLMNGKIEVDSELNEGSTFTVSIPFELSKKTKEVEIINLVNNDILTKKLKILVAEDDLTNQHLIKALAKNKPWELVVVDNGEKAVHYFQLEKFDIILMDIQMPIMNGIEATQTIRQFEKDNNSHVPIIALTAYAMENDKEKCFDAGMDAFLSKPININKLYSTIDKYVK
ncbi:MAG TPA: hypothetical protein DDX39_02990 [Bacteroidales bacterium]|nr:MAG: hypothetical protein A2W98_02895 [Bacteroidetes bacterium GWF2_33_38]OFY74600.1 MAG: hypothetical protein A2265_03770 [Bacteroidetes bacterium RIFOXYA12_FULL_33_9]HBF87584.1 hypothetical protein [Bacteroidales bacterium]